MKIWFSVSLVAVLCSAAIPAGAQLTVNTVPISGLSEPSGLAEDAQGNLYVADSANNRIVVIDAVYLTPSVLAGTGSPGSDDGVGISATFNNPQGILIAGTNTLIVADYGNNLIRAVRLSDGYVTTLAGQVTSGPAVNSTGTNATFHYPSGLTQDSNNNVYIADWGNNTIRVMNLNDPALGVTNLTISGAALYRPWAVAFAGSNQLWVADAGNTSSDNTIKLLTLSTPTTATLTTFIGGNSIHVAGGFRNSTLGGTNVLFNNPRGLLWLNGTGLLICDSGNNCVRLATNNPLYGVTNYAVTTFAGVPESSGTADGPAASATFASPNSLVVDSAQLLYLSDSGAGIGNPLRSIQNGSQDFKPVPAPVVGYVVIVMDPLTGLPSATLKTDLPHTFFNDPTIAVADETGTTINFTYGPNALFNSIPNPTPTFFSNSVAAYDQNNTSAGNVPVSIMAGKPLSPSLIIKAIGVAPPSSSRPPSPVASGEFIFQTAAVQNVAPDHLDPFHVQLACGTSNSVIYYTLDGSNPTNSPSSFVWDPNAPYLKISPAHFTNGFATLTAIARRTGYYDSAAFAEAFNISNAVYDVTMSPNSGYYPMGQTIQVTCPSTNVYYTMDGTEPTTNSLPVKNIAANIGYIRWFNTVNDLTSLRVKAFANDTNSNQTAAGQPVPISTIGTPTDFNPQLRAGIGSSVVIPVVCNLATNQQVQSYQFRVEIAPANNANTPALVPLSIIPTNDFAPLVTAAQGGAIASNSIVSYTYGVTNGLAIFALGSGSHVLFQHYAVVALLEVQIPYVANVGDTYTLNVLWPSATSDAYNSPVSLTPLPPVTIMVTNLPYTVGDSASAAGSWYNAGGFGDDNLDNSDVNQAFYAASGLRVPYIFSDVFNAMDAYPVDTPTSVGGDGHIRFLDWMTILNRSLRFDPNNWAREWSIGGELVDFTTNLIVPQVTAPLSKDQPLTSAPWYRQVLLGADSVGNASPNSTVQVPVYAKLGDGSTLSGLQFRVVVTPLGDAPALTTSPQLNLAAGVAGPLLTQSFKPGETAFGWSLGSFNYLSRSSNFLGWISFTVPTNAVTGQSYSVSLDNADGAPDLTHQYDFETRSATVTVNTSAPPATICSDEWKIHFFGSLTNPAAADLADPDGDGIPNWMEYLAGTDPTDPNSKLQIRNAAMQAVKGQRQLSMQWLTAPGHAYAVQWSAGLTDGTWNTLTTISGDGSVTNYPDAGAGGGARFYRLQVLP